MLNLFQHLFFLPSSMFRCVPAPTTCGAALAAPETKRLRSGKDTRKQLVGWAVPLKRFVIANKGSESRSKAISSLLPPLKKGTEWDYLFIILNLLQDLSSVPSPQPSPPTGSGSKDRLFFHCERRLKESQRSNPVFYLAFKIASSRSLS